MQDRIIGKKINPSYRQLPRLLCTSASVTVLGKSKQQVAGLQALVHATSVNYTDVSAELPVLWH